MPLEKFPCQGVISIKDQDVPAGISPEITALIINNGLKTIFTCPQLSGDGTCSIGILMANQVVPSQTLESVKPATCPYVTNFIAQLIKAVTSDGKEVILNGTEE